MPCSVFVAGQLAVKEPAEAGRTVLFILRFAPTLDHRVKDGRHNVLAGHTEHIGDVALFTGRHNLGSGLADENTILRGTGNRHGIFALFFRLLPSGKQCLGRKRAQRSKIGTACLSHHIFPEGIQLLHRLGGQHFADAAATAHHSLGKQPLRQRGQA